MASKIRVLSDHTINQIAAGEVIENPSSVVKELVENSLDAGATDICIEIQGGGRQMIRISDNGCGMNGDDAVLCLERHATSKLRDVDDIHALSTMGFRGEAIPSIASISKFNLLTCPAPDESNAASTLPPSHGTMVIVDGGKLISCTPAARAPGTTIEVKALFFNVPVRKKFLRSPSVDANEIFKTVSLMALGNPSIKFQLINDGKSQLLCPAGIGADFKEKFERRIESALGSDFLQNTLYIKNNSGEITLEGVIGLPSYTRHNRTGQYLYINRRPVNVPLVAYALKEGYGTSLDSGRFPVFVLHLSLAGEWVDVNVHPQKREVRLRQEQMIREMIVKAVRETLSHRHKPETALKPSTGISPVFAKAFSTAESFSRHDASSTWEFQPKRQPEPPPPQRADHLAMSANSVITSPAIFKSEVAKSSHKETYAAPSLDLQNNRVAPPKVMTTLSGYLLIDTSSDSPFLDCVCRALDKRGLILVDQKNAHARIIFEKLSQHKLGSSVAQQTLLIPHMFEMPPHESDSLRLILPHLNQMGIQIQEFGQNTFMINALPQIFGNSNLDVLIRDIVHDTRSLNFGQSSQDALQQERNRKIALAASRAAVSCQRRLSIFEGQALIDELVACNQPYVCPSGNPVIIHMSAEELAKMFQK